MTDLFIDQLVFYSQKDESNMFSWLDKIDGVLDIKGDGDRIIVKMHNNLSDDALHELIALFYRYGINMKQLAEFRGIKNEIWFCNPKMFWYRLVFG